MAIPCPTCSREYDVTLFQYGRTIRCACGSRVGLEKRIGPPRERIEKPPRFIADAMLGGLARWLRLLGYDTAYDPEIPDEELVRRGLDEGRTVLTRDRRLPEEWRVRGILVVDEEERAEQLRTVVDRLGLVPRRDRLFSRCSRCNAPLEPAGAGEVADRVPERTLEERDRFRRCPSCDRIYWEGSHTERIRRRLESVLEGAWR